MVTFDGLNKIILVNSGITSLDIGIVYSLWKEWVLTNPHWEAAMKAIGGEPIPGGRIGSTYFLMNGWRIRPWDGEYRLSILGNLYTEEGESPYVPVGGVSVVSTVSSLNTVWFPDSHSTDIAQAVWESAEALKMMLHVEFMDKVLRNKREIKKVNGMWYLIVYDTDQTTEILAKPLKDVFGSNITDLSEGILSREDASVI